MEPAGQVYLETGLIFVALKSLLASVIYRLYLVDYVFVIYVNTFTFVYFTFLNFSVESLCAKKFLLCRLDLKYLWSSAKILDFRNMELNNVKIKLFISLKSFKVFTSN